MRTSRHLDCPPTRSVGVPKNDRMSTSHRREHLQSTLLESIQTLLQRGLADPRLEGALVTVTRVVLAQDLRNATVWISVLPEKAQRRAIAAIQHAGAHIRRQVGDRLGLPIPPALTFDLDTSGKKQAAVLDALSKVRQEREAAGLPPPPPAEATPGPLPSNPGAPPSIQGEAPPIPNG